MTIGTDALPTARDEAQTELHEATRALEPSTRPLPRRAPRHAQPPRDGRSDKLVVAVLGGITAVAVLSIVVAVLVVSSARRIRRRR